MNKFTHLHVHTQYSLLDGTSKIGELLDRAKELGFTSLAITDHGVMYGAVEFYEEAQKRGIKPIIGCEVYTAPGSRHSRVYGVDSVYGHLVLLCKNYEGYKNLMTMVSLAHTEGYYYKPRVDRELLSAYSDGIIALSGCLKGEVSACLISSDYEGAKRKALEYREIFGEGNFYLEIQNHGIEEEDLVREGMKRLSRETGIPLIATNDIHYIKREDALLQDVVTCIQTGKKIDDPDRLRFFGSEFYLKSQEEMEEAFSDVPEALENSADIVQKCNLTIDFGTLHLPKITLDTTLTHEEYLRNLCMEGAGVKYPEITEEITKRIDYELDVINSMGYTDYFLIVWDFIKFAKDSGIPVGPGRGSAAGSIVAYTLNITEVDPLKYDLLFERFLNPERVSMPDIDIDICNERRDEVKEYVTQKYGTTRVASIITFGTMAARAAVRDVGRVLGMEPALVDRVAKSIPETPGITLSQALSMEGDLKKYYSQDTSAKKLIDLALKAEGLVRHASTHAAGVVIADDELTSYVPVQSADKGILTQYPMGSLEKIGLLKMDFLGLRNLTIIDNTLRLVEKTTGQKIDISNLNYDDPKTFALIQKGDTDGVFQLENPGLKAFLRKFKPSRLEDIIATTSIYRPGPMDQIPAFLKNVQNPKNITYMHPLLKPILEPTYGTIIYQEQVMSIVRSLAGYSLGRADLVRRAMAKKKPEQMAKEREVFINGLLDDKGNVLVPGTRRKGIDDAVSNRIFDMLTDFANYAFNKSHAACYARVAYQTAYLKANYPTQYLVALLESLLGNSHKTFKYVTGFARYGIKLLPPDVNKSAGGFLPEGKNVRFGLSALKNVGMSFPNAIEAERKQNGPFKSFTDFVNRMATYDMNKRTMEVLIKCGAFDSIHPNRRELLLNSELLVDAVQKDTFGKSRDQVSFFGEIDDEGANLEMQVTDVEDFTPAEKFAMESDLSGMYLSGNPMKEYLMYGAAFSQAAVYSINDGDVEEGKKLNLCGILTKVSTTRTKSGVFLCNMSFSDYYDTAELTAFESTYNKYRHILSEGRAVMITAVVKKRNEEISLSMISAISLEEMNLPQNPRLYVKLSDKAMIKELKPLLHKHRGDGYLCLYCEDTGEKLVADKAHGVKLTNELVGELSDILGFDNVRIR